MSLAWYLYGVVAADDARADLRVGAAVDPEHEVELVTEGPLAGVASRVSLREFDQDALPERLADVNWLEQKIRAHEQVLEGVLDGAAVVPCRFCTVYRSEDELRRFLSERRSDLAAALGRVQGQIELGVKAFVDREGFTEMRTTPSDPAREQEGAEGGRAYLERRRREQHAASELAEFKRDAGADIHSRLSDAAEDARWLPLQPPELAGREGEMFLNGAYLVDAADRSAFEEELAGLARRYGESGVHLELTGPWPAYNFVPAELGAATA